jgi:hypothetical protein
MKTNLIVTANCAASSTIVPTLKMEAARSSERRFHPEPHGAIFPKTALRSCKLLTGNMTLTYAVAGVPGDTRHHSIMSTR